MVWRIADTPWYRLLFLVILLAELTLLGLLAGSFMIYISNSATAAAVRVLLLIAVLGTLVGLVVLTVFGFVVQLLSRRHQQATQQAIDHWVGRWLDLVLFQADDALPAAPLSPTAAEALVRLGDVIGDDALAGLHELLRHYRLPARWLVQLRARDALARLEALEALARLRLPETLPAIQAQMRDPVPMVRAAAAKTAAHIVGSPLTGATHLPALIETLLAVALPTTALEECLAMTGARAEAVLRGMLHHPDLSEMQLLAVINVAGWLHLDRLAAYMALHLEHPAPAIRAACLRVLAQMDRLPGDSQYAIQQGVQDADERVRLQAVRALAVLPLYRSYGLFWQAIQDESWWVQLAAAETLWQKGEAGHRMLEEITHFRAQQHAGQIARHLLANAGDINADVWIWSRG